MRSSRAEAADVYKGMNIMQRHAMVGGFAQDVINKIGKEAISKQREKEIFDKGVTEGISLGLVVMMGILWNDWGKCNRRATRLKRAFDLFNEKLASIDKPDELQQLAEKAFSEQTGSEITR